MVGSDSEKREGVEVGICVGAGECVCGGECDGDSGACDG